MQPPPGGVADLGAAVQRRERAEQRLLQQVLGIAGAAQATGVSEQLRAVKLGEVAKARP